MRKLPIARKYFKRLTVEVPSLKETYKYLVENKLIHRLQEYGVDQLNLAELHLNVNNYKSYIDLPAYIYRSFYFSGLSPIESRVLTYRIIKYAVQNKIKMVINDCSNDIKHLQILRRSMNPLLFKLMDNK